MHKGKFLAHTRAELARANARARPRGPRDRRGARSAPPSGSPLPPCGTMSSGRGGKTPRTPLTAPPQQHGSSAEDARKAQSAKIGRPLHLHHAARVPL